MSGRDPDEPVENADGSVGNKIRKSLAGWNRIMDINSTGPSSGPNMGRAMANSGAVDHQHHRYAASLGLFGSYHASKGSVRLLTAAAMQCAADKVRVNSIHPGFVDTPMTAPAHAIMRSQPSV